LKKGSNSPAADPKAFLQEKLFPILVVAECITIILGFSDKFLQFFDAMRAHFYLINTLLLLTALLFIYNSKFRNRKIKVALYGLVSFLYLGLLCFHIWEIKFRRTGPAVHPDINLGLIDFFGFVTLESKPSIAPFTIEEFYLNDQLCSFTETKEFKFAEGPEQFRTFAYNQDVNVAFQKGCCVGLYGNQPIKKVLPLLYRRLDNIHRPDLKEYIKTSDDLSRVIISRGDIFNQIMFSDLEIQELKKTDSVDYITVRNWLVSCIGIKNPVITFTLKNASEQDIIIAKVVYDVTAVGQVKGGASGPLYPIITYDHYLEHHVGLQERKLNPSIQLAGQGIVSFNIRLIPTDKSPGLCWVLRVRIYDSQGNFRTTEPVQLIMSK
jgi:hypothetical protein